MEEALRLHYFVILHIVDHELYHYTVLVFGNCGVETLLMLFGNMTHYRPFRVAGLLSFARIAQLDDFTGVLLDVIRLCGGFGHRSGSDAGHCRVDCVNELMIRSSVLGEPYGGILKINFFFYTRINFLNGHARTLSL